MEKEKRYFEWIDGEDKGTVLTLDYIETEPGYDGKVEETYVFTNGDSCNKEFISPMVEFAGELCSVNSDGSRGVPKFMVEVSSPANVWTFSNASGKVVDVGIISGSDTGKRNVPSLEDILSDGGKKVKNFTLVPPPHKTSLRSLPSADDYKRFVEPPVVETKEEVKEVEPQKPIVEEVSEPVYEEETKPEPTILYKKPQYSMPSDDPVSILVATSKKEEKEVDMRITLSLPTKELFAIASTNFENGETKFIDNIVKDLDISEIISAIRETLLESYKASISDEANS